MLTALRLVWFSVCSPVRPKEGTYVLHTLFTFEVRILVFIVERIAFA